MIRSEQHRQSDEEKKENRHRKRIRRFRFFRFYAIVLCTVFVVMIAFGIKRRIESVTISKEDVKNVIVGEEGKVTTVTQTSLEKVIKTSKLYTAEYSYNGYVPVLDEERNNIKYYVAYEGKVKAGIDVSRISVTMDEETNTIIIQLPQVKLENPIVDVGSLQYIFEDKKYETETVAQEAYKKAIEDLEKRVNQDENILASATESARLAEEALVKPWVNQVAEDETYDVKVLAFGEE